MPVWEQTSNVSVTVTEEKTDRVSVNNLQAHIRKVVLTGNAKEEYGKYNYEFKTEYSGTNYRDAVWKNLKVGTKFDKSKLEEGQFWVGRTYKKRSGKTTTYVEAMTIAPPWKVHPDDIEVFLKSNENTYFDTVRQFLMTDEQFKDCIFLDFQVHLDEVYIPESVTQEDGSEYMLPEEERWQYAYIKPHMHISYIPTVKATDKNGVEFLKLSRTDLWKSKSGKFNQSYREFNDKKYEMVDREYGLERGMVYDELPPEERPVRKKLEQWQKDNDTERAERLIQQQKKEFEKTIAVMETQAEQILQDREMLAETKEQLKEEMEDYVADVMDRYNLEYQEMDAVFNREEKALLLKALNMIERIIEPIAKVFPSIFKQVKELVADARQRIEFNNRQRNILCNNYHKNDER